MPSSIANVSKNFLFLCEAPWIRLRIIVLYRGQNDVESDEEEYVRGLADCWCITEHVHFGTTLLISFVAQKFSLFQMGMSALHLMLMQ